MKKLIIFHGSDHIISHPTLEEGKETNDYGKGFYCTFDLNMAKEWACKTNKDGFVNKYSMEVNELKILDLQDKKYNVLNWIAILLKNRTFDIQDEIALDAKKYIIKNFYIDITKYDVVIGYRADDSYFSYAESFISNSLPVRLLEEALKLGKLGIQFVLVSKKAFKEIKFMKSEIVKKEIYFPKFQARDTKARKDFNNYIKKEKSYESDIFVMDILRKEMRNNDPLLR